MCGLMGRWVGGLEGLVDGPSSLDGISGSCA